MSMQSATPVGLLTEREAAAYLKISARSLWEARKAGRVAVVKPTPFAVRYTIADLDAFIASQRQPATK